MEWTIWKSHGPKQLTDELKKLLALRFRLDAQSISRMWYVEQDGVYNHRTVKYIKVFDPSLLCPEPSSPIKSFEDAAGHREAVLFEGHIERNGFIYVTDRRHPRVFARKPRSNTST
jgi:hypothetical protein